MQLLSSTRSVRLAAAPAPRPTRRATAVVFSSDKEEATPASGSIFYGGKTYTEAEFQQAVDTQSLPQAPIRPSTAVAAAPTFNDVMGFSGTVPEIVNGRLAMLGFVAAVAAELSSGQGVLKQLTEEPTGIASVFLLIIAGSLVPAFMGSRAEKLGPLTPTAELINGRGAMIGFAAMLLIEGARGQALF